MLIPTLIKRDFAGRLSLMTGLSTMAISAGAAISAAAMPSLTAALGGGWRAALALWGIPALVATRGEFFKVGIGKHVGERSVGVLEGHGLRGVGGYLGSLPFYGLTLMAGFLPWSPWLVRSVWKRRSQGPLQAIDRYLGAGIVTVFVVFTLIRTKLPHYTLPAFPLIALWLGKTLALDGTDTARIRRHHRAGSGPQHLRGDRARVPFDHAARVQLGGRAPLVLGRPQGRVSRGRAHLARDRKSTRLNSSHRT